ncbi:hypothetical protein PMG11_06511 [Penicillium brasilianum]|uniref:Uncharacterized protein n=1 Tax=Penicillium brasilianum TaxID=104259 RepID=A0A0F7TS28_PENBI|nr:hypothetical protein PMG11_06511 [Penicillium brasilianum]
MDSRLDFFARFPEFDYHPDAPITKEFKRLAQQRKWKHRSKTWRKNWNLCMKADYQSRIGAQVSKIETWQRMCTKVGIAVFPSITKCKKALSKVYVNIIDLLECWDTHRTPKRFGSIGELANYSRSTDKVYPRDAAKVDPALRVLLKRLL